MELTYKSLFEYNSDIFKVYNYENKIRLGSNYDNGYVIGDLDKNYDCYISVGISQEDSFTVSFTDRYNLNINDCWAFDGTINELPLNIKDKIQFVKKNVGSFNNEKNTNLHYLFDKYNNIFLKMDIEGCEWEWIKCMDEEKINKISQIVIEFHGITNVSWHNNFTFDCFNTTIEEKINCLEKMSKTHYLIHAHGNNADKIVYNGIPNVIELTYINKKYFNEIPCLNINPLPNKELDKPNEINMPDIDLNFYPFVNLINNNPFIINIQDKLDYNENDYIDIQNKLNEKNIDSIIESLYSQKNKFYTLIDFKSRITRGIKQQLSNNTNQLPIKTLHKIGNYEDNNNCLVCCTPFTIDSINSSRLIASSKIVKSLEEIGYNGHFYLFNGGFPNPSGKEMKYAGVPYSFKIFMMLEAYKLGFNKVIWIDSGCYAINNPKPLFDILSYKDIIAKTINNNNNYDAMSFEKTIRLLNQLTKCDLHTAAYIETIVFGLNMNSIKIKSFIKDYYEMVELGWPFFSIFPEEIVFSALFNKSDYKLLLHNDNLQQKLQIHESRMNEYDAKNNGYYFHHKKYLNYIKKDNNCIITFDDNKGRFGNQLFCYVISKLFTYKFGHNYISREQFDSNDYCIINEENIEEYLKNSDLNKNIILRGFFQKSKYFVNFKKELMELIYNKTNNETNNDYFILDNTKYFIKDYLINSKHNIKLNKDDIIISLRLDDFIQYPCPISDILPPQYYMDILNNIKINSKIYIICDKIKLDWEFKYIEYFKFWNPIIIQDTLINDIALMRDCNNLIHSNSSLCWIISFLSEKEKRFIPFTPKIYMNQNQNLEKISQNDTLKYIDTLTHDEVFKLNFNSNHTIFPLSFSIPDECVVNNIPNKTYLLASLIPGDISTYIFKNKEKEYNEMYQKSRFAITKKKGGWDCLRHYEILMNGCIPLFENLNDCPNNTLTTYPKHLNDEAYELYNNWIENEEYIMKYNKLCEQFLEHTRNYCTTTYSVKYFLNNIKNGDKVKNILLITGHSGINYNRESLWIGLKRYCKEINGLAVEYEKIPFLYKDTDNISDFTYTRRLNVNDYIDMSQREIIEKINNKFWDLIIYGKVGPDEYCTFPLFDIVKANYNKDKIVFIYGGDEIFNLKITENNSYYINMFNVKIYYKPYVDYLNYYKNFGTCFVRELESRENYTLL
jgi:hypothetical protein